jgi:hypothetical protein
MSYERGGLGSLRPETHEKPAEKSFWQIAMRSFPPKLRATGNPGGINLIGPKSKNDERAYRSVPSLPTAAMPTLWPVGRLSVIKSFINTKLTAANNLLYGGRGLPQIVSVNVPLGAGKTVSVDLPASGLTEADLRTLNTAASTGIVTLGDAANALIQVEGTTSSGERRRALQFVVDSFGLTLAKISVGQYTDAELARDILQGLVAVAIAIPLPFGINYIIAGVIQIASWAAGAWDKGMEPGEMVGYSYWWSEAEQREVLRYRLLVMTCADRESITRGVAGMTIQQVRLALQDTGYGLDKIGGGTTSTPSALQSKRALENAFDVVTNICRDPLEDARLIRQIIAFLNYAGVDSTSVDNVEKWLWDARRMERVDQGRRSGEIAYARNVGDNGIKNIGLFPDYWRDWAYDKKMTPERLTRANLASLNQYVRSRFPRKTAAGATDAAGSGTSIVGSLKTWHWAAIGIGAATLLGFAAYELTDDDEPTEGAA